MTYLAGGGLYNFCFKSNGSSGLDGCSGCCATVPLQVCTPQSCNPCRQTGFGRSLRSYLVLTEHIAMQILAQLAPDNSNPYLWHVTVTPGISQPIYGNFVTCSLMSATKVGVPIFAF